MRVSLTLAALVATITASPIASNVLQPRQSACAVPPSTTTNIGGTDYTLQGPFKLQASSTSTATPSVNGNWAHAGVPNQYPYVVFGKQQTQATATEFYLDSANELVSIQAGSDGNPAIFYAYENPVSAVTGHVAIKADSTVTNKAVCSINSSTCALDCTVKGFSTDCLASPKYQPDWRIAGPAAAKKPGCIPFTPIVVVT